MRKQSPAITASFFERMKFLIEEGSSQNYARQESFNERYVLYLNSVLLIYLRYGIKSVKTEAGKWLYSVIYIM